MFGCCDSAVCIFDTVNVTMKGHGDVRDLSYAHQCFILLDQSSSVNLTDRSNLTGILKLDTSSAIWPPHLRCATAYKKNTMG